jgi:predicted DNA-binding protein
MIPVSIAMTARLARRLRLLAAMQDKSRSQLVREIVEARLSSLEVDCQHLGDEAL